MATSSVPVTPGSGGKNLATYSITEDAITKEISRVVLQNQVGTDLGTGSNPLNITQQPATMANATLQSAAAATGNGTTLAVSGESSVILTVSGTFVGTITLEGSEDGTNFSALTAAQLGTTNVGTTIAAPGVFEVSVAGLSVIRARVSAYTSGAITVTGHTSPVSYNEKVVSLGNVTQTDGAAATSSNVIAVGGFSTGDSHIHRLATDNAGVLQVNLGNVGIGTFGNSDGTIAGITSAVMFNENLGFNGSTWDRLRVPVIFKNIAAVAVTAATPVTVWTPAAGKKFRLMGYSVSSSVAGSVIFKDNVTEVLRTPTLLAGDNCDSPPSMGNGILSTAANNTLKIDVTATGSVSGFVFGTEE